MSKIKLLLDVVSDLRSLADSLQAVAAVIADNEPAEPIPADTPTQPQAPVIPTKTVNLEQVRAVLAEKSQDGFTADVRKILQKHGASKLSQIDPSDYAALLSDAEELK